jgi:nucleoside-diphosphate-sugar epimerase
MVNANKQETLSYVSDVVEANMQAISMDAPVGQVINIDTGNKITLNELLKTFCDIKGMEFNAEHQEHRQDDIKESYANVSKAKSMLD